MSRDEVTPADLSDRLGAELADVVAALGLKVQASNRNRIVAWSPNGQSRSAKLNIRLYPRQQWIDYETGHKGDALDLVAMVLAGGGDPRSNRSQAVKWARDRYGLSGGGVDRAKWARDLEAARRRRAAREREAAEQLSAHRKRAQAIWLSGFKMHPGDHAWAYFRARGIDLDRLSRLPGAVRFHPFQPYYFETADAETGELKRRVVHTGPCILSAMTLPDGGFGSVHRTWIDPFSPGQKLDLTARFGPDAKPRKMWPSSEGAVIRLWRGGGQRPASVQAQRTGELEDVAVCEGVEDGLSIALMTPELRIDAVGSLSGLASYQPYPFTRRLIVAADNDWNKPQAVAQLEAACRRLVSDFGLEVRIARSPSGKDFNDLLRGAA